jgi:selenide,water dikinase
MPNYPCTRDLVLVGGGHAHALVLRRWAMEPLPGARLTVIDPAPAVSYSGMLPGFVAGHYARAELDIDLVRLARAAGARLILGAAEGIDLSARTVAVAGRPPVAWDVLSLDIGVTSAMPELPGFARHGVPVKPLSPFAAAWAAFAADPGQARVCVIGAGVAGVEIALAIAHALRHRPGRVTLIDSGRALSAVAPATRRRLHGHLAARGVTVEEGAVIAAVHADHVELADGRAIASDFTVGAAGARPAPWLAGTGLVLHAGHVAIDDRLRASAADVFAAGDCAHMTATPRPKAGVFAVRQAPVLFHNLRAALGGGPMRRYRPQRDYLKLISLGGRSALAEKWGTAVAGAALWRLKDRIDRRFMAMFTTLPAMPRPAVPRPAARGLAEAMGEAPPCAGCGAKVARSVLAGALSALPAARGDVLLAAGDDAAILMTGGLREVLTTDHLRAVTPDPVLMTRIAAVHALGDIWAMGAQPRAALLSLVLPPMTPALQSRTLAEIVATAAEVLGAAGAAIAGGHTTQGEEFAIGVTLTGLCARAPITLAGAQAGDALILTKPIGSGTVLAAEMRGRARGADVAACWRAMCRPQDRAAAILAGAHAMTDVTGFGLAGHLAAMAEASGLAAQLDLAGIPLLPGAEALAAAGIRSSLWAGNRGGAGPVFGPPGPRFDLLFDPQTCGGLLAAVPAAEAPALLAALLAAGEGAAIIGALTAGPPGITCR